MTDQGLCVTLTKEHIEQALQGTLARELFLKRYCRYQTIILGVGAVSVAESIFGALGLLQDLKAKQPRLMVLLAVSPYRSGPYLADSRFQLAAVSIDETQVFADPANFEWQESLIRSAKTLVELLELGGVLLVDWSPVALGSLIGGEHYAGINYTNELDNLAETLKFALKNHVVLFYSGAGNNPDFEFLSLLDGMQLDVECLSVDDERAFVTKVGEASAEALRKRKRLILNVCGGAEKEQRMFIYCSYLLHRTYSTCDLQYITKDKDLPWFPEWDYNLGTPEGAVHSNGDLLFRQYGYGLVVVNPTDTTVSCGLDGLHTSLVTGGLVSSISLPARTGAILGYA